MLPRTLSLYDVYSLHLEPLHLDVREWWMVYVVVFVGVSELTGW